MSAIGLVWGHIFCFFEHGCVHVSIDCIRFSFCKKRGNHLDPFWENKSLAQFWRSLGFPNWYPMQIQTRHRAIFAQVISLVRSMFWDVSGLSCCVVLLCCHFHCSFHALIIAGPVKLSLRWISTFCSNPVDGTFAACMNLWTNGE